MLLLDTCALIWLDTDPSQFSAPATAALAAAGSICVSAASAFEVAVKHRKGKLGLPLPPPQWFAAVLTAHGIIELPITSPIAIAAAELPLIHSDPFDRIIIATAQLHGLTILTPDATFRSYPSTDVQW